MFKRKAGKLMLLLSAILVMGSGIFYGRDLYLRYQQSKSVRYVKNHLKTSVKGQRYDTDIQNFEYDDAWAAYRDAIIKKYGVGTVEIPAVNIALPILEGVSSEKMAVGVVTVKPNQEAGLRNFALAGHNMTARGNLLHNLTNVRLGNKIKVTTSKGQFIYVVTEVHHDWPQSQGQIVDDDQGDKIITIYTCDNAYMDRYGHTSKSIYVRGRLEK
ncbi:hypothetical protein FC20_GL000213 [Lactobacillus equicursoris DSM 19284 = JCM 14600 = CIP 110162]|uniref:Sortase n=2 Tax=Lactobacillaceae TaxID=33958 RepID=A0A0R1LTB8_9LACO|nr:MULTISPECIES: class A sortase [Lactobacillaceae]KRK96819.1 hypothetical protein FC20_GL000213 [Lactobacillus equicursoris DSM 19284 = JCM 14600 = CIP 110162]KRM22814.1 hypothetical protein FC90_GL000591 [Latilactobacillus graminis DSM 20719]